MKAIAQDIIPAESSARSVIHVHVHVSSLALSGDA